MGDFRDDPTSTLNNRCALGIGGWCARQDSNLQPFAPEANALSIELRARVPIRNYTIAGSFGARHCAFIGSVPTRLRCRGVQRIREYMLWRFAEQGLALPSLIAFGKPVPLVRAHVGGFSKGSPGDWDSRRGSKRPGLLEGSQGECAPGLVIFLRNEPRSGTGSVNPRLGSCALYHRGVQPLLAVATPNWKNALCHSSPVACSFVPSEITRETGSVIG